MMKGFARKGVEDVCLFVLEERAARGPWNDVNPLVGQANATKEQEVVVVMLSVQMD